MPQSVDPAFAHGFLQRLHDAVNAHDARAIGALCTEDVKWEDPAAPHTLHGRAAVEAFHRDIMFPALPDAHIALIGGPYLALDGMGIAARLHISGTMTGALTPPGFAATGKRLSFETAEFSQFEGGLLARHTVVVDMLELARQIGAVPKAGSVADRLGVWMQHLAAFWSRTHRDRGDPGRRV
jgi:predicted ester cyclase